MTLVLRSFAVLLSVYAIGRWISPPVPLFAVAMQSLPVVASLVLAAWRGSPARMVLGLFLLSNVVLVYMHLPAVVDMDWWMMQVDMALLTGLVVCSSSRSLLRYTADVSRIQLAWFYFAAGFLKLTKYHSDWKLSCSSIFLSHIAIAWVPAQWMLPDTVLLAILKAAPFITDVVENGIALLLFLGRSADLDGDSRRRTKGVGWRATALHLGLLGAIALHVGIMIAPPPNSIANFGAMCISRLFLTIPVPVALASVEVACGLLRRGPERDLLLLGTAAVVGIVTLVSVVHQDISCIVANATLTGFSLLTIRAIHIQRTSTVEGNKGVDEEMSQISWSRSACCSAVFVSLAVFYAIGMPALGLVDQGISHMFGHLKVHGGGSHYILPTGLLQRWLYDSSPLDATLGPLRDFAGGELRIEASTSALLNEEFPYQRRHLYPHPIVQSRLQRLGHATYMFSNNGGARNPSMTSRKVCGDGEHSGLSALGLGSARTQPPVNGADGEFIRYSLPALEVRTMLAEMRRRREAFRLEYTRIKGPIPWGIDEAEEWRIDGCGVRVALRENGRGTRECFSYDSCINGMGAQFLPDAPDAAANRLLARSSHCADDEIAMMDTTPGPVAATFLFSNPYPIVRWPGTGELIYARLCGFVDCMNVLPIACPCGVSSPLQVPWLTVVRTVTGLSPTGRRGRDEKQCNTRAV